ncbi:MAG TPA: 6-carboxytetrahydropterin synthase [Candidatus Marinimicrobia bacterium]|jgi:6-pyruvoyltetrahydropterin/6-carboxytetrahydropterin synthase|nr:6-carboxytetrahydropterin synthase [Candidatus Neomarinimicrobiota bacterium]HIB61112.1 6-carboxytetrahydropterin synthase [Candidatus Neomarinimicrobiota bacterium]HIN97036.1 6-carboxytetrahydropterin synthase [Candidatus Neomarinimicrobiota bacterium]
MQFLTKTFHFCAAHQYGHANWSAEKNVEVFKEDAKVHGHNYILEVTVKGEVNPDTGFIVDLYHLKQLVQEDIIAVLDHSQIEKDIPWFMNKQPSTENIVVFIWETIAPKLQGAELHRIRLRETPTITTDYYGPNCC